MVIIKKVRRVFYGWWIVASSFILFAVIGGTNFYGFTAFFNPIVDEMGWTSTQTSLAFSLRSIEGGFLRPVIGFLIDRIGARKTIFTGIIISGIALVLLSRTNSLYYFYGIFLLLALGLTCALGTAQYAAIANWFSRRRSLAMGILSAGFGLSGAMTPLLVWLINNHGWRVSLVIIGIATLIIGIPLSLVARHRPEPYGYLPDGNHTKKDATPPLKTGNPPEIRSSFSIKQALKTKDLWLMIAFGFCTSFSITAITVHEMPYLISVGISEEMAAITMLGITGSSLIGRLGFSWLGDIYDKRRLLAIAATLQVTGVLIFAFIEHPWMIIPFLLTFGPGYGAPIPIMPALQADYFGTKTFASLRGIYAISWTIPGIVAPLFAGWIYDSQGSYRLAFIVFAILCSLAIPVILFTSKHRHRSGN
jgi:sugar phosphate permease